MSEITEQPRETQKPRRRWLQYSLRGLLLVMLLAACGAWWLSRKIEEAQREQQAISKLVEMPGVTIHYSYQLDEQGELTQPQLPTPDDHPWLRHWFGDAFVDDPTHLLLAPTFTFNKENVAPLRDLPSLQVIYAQAPFRSYEPGAAAVFGELPALREMRMKGGVNWSEEDIAAWGQLTQLEHLEFEGNASWGDAVNFTNLRHDTTLSAAAVSELTRNLPRLSTLYLTGFALEKDALSGLARLRTLQELKLELCTVENLDLICLEKLPLINLQLRHVNVTDGDLASIGQISTLDDLNLGYTDITDAGLAHLASLSTLTSLNLSDCKQLDGSGLQVVTQFPQLRLLSLSGTNVTEEHAKVLRECSSLTMLGLPQHISAETVAELKAALPGCMVLQ